MKIQINNYRGVASADIDLSRIALVAAPNGSGKTSVAQAVAAVLTGETVPINGVKKSQGGLLVRSGTAAGGAKITTDAGTMEVKWPGASSKLTGTPPAASVYAAGLRSIVDLDDKTRIQVLTDYLHAKPTKADLDKSLATLNMPAGTADKLWQLIESTGWDATYNQVKEKGAKLKGQWEFITNDNYGGKKADTWIPAGYDAALEGAAEDTLKAVITDARDALEAAIATNAIDGSERQKLAELAGMVGERTAAVAKAKAVTVDDTELQNLKQQLADGQKMLADGGRIVDELRAEVKRIEPPAEKSHPSDRMFCPECKTMLYVSGRVLKKVEPNAPIDEKALKAAREALSNAETTLAADTATVQSLRDAHTKASDVNVSAMAARVRAIDEAERLLKESTDAKAKIAEHAAAPQGKAVPVEECREALAAAELRLQAFTSKRDADRLHASITQNQELLTALAPTGVRGDVLTAALGKFNTIIQRVTTPAGWGKVEITPEFQTWYNGNPYMLLSESEKFRARVALQFAMAACDGSQAIVVDDADILDKGGRNGLIKAAKASGGPVLICMTIDARDQVPDLEKAGYGVSYWIEGGVVGAI